MILALDPNIESDFQSLGDSGSSTRWNRTTSISQPSKVLTHLLPVPLGQHGLLLPPLELARARGEAGPHLPHDLAHLVGVHLVRGIGNLVPGYGQLRKAV